MRLPRKKNNNEGNMPGPEDTQEMFAAGQATDIEAQETREYETPDEIVEEKPDETVDVEVEELFEEDDLVDEDDLDIEEEDVWEEDEEDETWEEGEPEEPTVSEPSPTLVRMTEARDRVKSKASELLKGIGETRLPRNEVDGQKVLIGAGIVLIALMIGVGGYVLGKGAGDDVDTARLQGEIAGKKSGAIAGATKGYAAGFAKGRDLAFQKSYAASYRRNYRRAYENAGMDPPAAKDIEVPKP